MDPDPNLASILDPDPNSMYLDPQHLLCTVPLASLALLEQFPGEVESSRGRGRGGRTWPPGPETI